MRINIFKGLIATFNVLLHCCITFLRLLRLANCIFISLKFVFDVIKCCIPICGDGSWLQIQPRSVKHNATFQALFNFRHNAVVLRVMLKFSSITYITLLTTALPPAVQLYVAIKAKTNDLGEGT